MNVIGEFTIVAAILPKDIEKALKDRDPPPIVEELRKRIHLELYNRLPLFFE